ncbi:MAG: hypothetical protein J7L46_05730 [Bacteroidales bacterium]|nr:hypothetical protein [Bacteroidales bacterium]
MEKNKKSLLLGIIATLLFHVAAIVILVFLGFKPAPPPFPEPDGIIISFGNTDNGFGEPQPPANQQQSQATNSQEENLTQNDVEAPALQEEHHDHHPTNQTNNNTQQNEEQNQEQQINENALFHPSNNNGNSGVTEGNGNQGDPNGDPNSNSPNNFGQGTSGISYSMGGRSAQALPPPKYPPGNVSGKVVLNIKVDKDGNVIAVSLGQGSTTINKNLVKEAKIAAWHAKFSVDAMSIEQTGTITYNFKLR